MRVALTGNTMTYFSGQPLYVFETAREFKRAGHDVDVISEWSDNELKSILEGEGVNCLTRGNGVYDVAYFSELSRGVEARTIINIVHSEYECETPLKGCDGYVCIRPSIKEHIINEHGIPEDKIVVIRNGVDRTRFKPAVKSPRDYKLLVAPCTLDPLRSAFINHLASTASKDKRVMFVGDNYGIRIVKNEFVEIVRPEFNVEKFIQQADEVHGILLGRVNIEAYSCGVDSYMWNPDTLEVEKFEPENFDEEYNIKNVVKKLINFYNELTKEGR